MTDEEIRQRAFRRVGRVMQAMNALHDVLHTHVKLFTDEEMATMGSMMRDKLASMMNLEVIDLKGRVQLPIPENGRARPPEEPRMPAQRTGRDYSNYGGIPYKDI